MVVSYRPSLIPIVPSILGEGMDYASPNALKARRDYANALLYGNRQQDVKHPLQGLSNMFAAFTGAQMAGRAGASERAMKLGDSDTMVPEMPGTTGASPIPGGGGKRSEAPEGTIKAAYAPEGDASPAVDPNTGTIDNDLLKAYVKIESGGNPRAVTGSYKGLGQLSDREFARYGGGNIFDPNDNLRATTAKLTDDAKTLTAKLGRPPTQTELYMAHQQGHGGLDAHMNNPDAPAWQNMWSTAEGRAKGPGWSKRAIWGNIPSDVRANFPGGVDFVTSRDFMNLWGNKIARFRGGSGPVSAPPTMLNTAAPGEGPGTEAENISKALAFAGPQDEAGKSDAGVGGWVRALEGGNSPAAPTQAPATPLPFDGPARGSSSGNPNAGWGPPIVPPRLVPPRPKITREQVIRGQASDYLSPEQKAFQLQQYMQQGQPIVVPWQGGTVLVDPTNPNNQKWNAPLEKGKAEGGGASGPVYDSLEIGPDGKTYIRRVPKSGQQNPVPAPTAPQPDVKKPPSIGDTGTNKALQYTDEGQPSEALNYAPTDQPPGMLGQKPPPSAPGQDSGKTAFTSFGDPDIDQMAKAGADLEVEKKAQENFNAKDTDTYFKNYGAISNAGEMANKSVTDLELAQKVLEDPNMYTGFGDKLVLNLKQLQSLVDKNNPNAAASMELFQKLISGNILKDLKITLQGLGQVRIAEIDLLAKSAASLDRTLPSNRAVLDLMIRAHRQVSFLSDRANEYQEGWRWDDKGNAYKTNERPTSAGQNAVLKRFSDAMPTLSQKQIEDYTQLFEKGGYDPKKYKENRAFLEGAARGRYKDMKEDDVPYPGKATPNTAPPPPPGTVPFRQR